MLYHLQKEKSETEGLTKNKEKIEEMDYTLKALKGKIEEIAVVKVEREKRIKELIKEEIGEMRLA